MRDEIFDLVHIYEKEGVTNSPFNLPWDPIENSDLKTPEDKGYIPIPPPISAEEALDKLVTEGYLKPSKKSIGKFVLASCAGRDIIRNSIGSLLSFDDLYKTGRIDYCSASTFIRSITQRNGSKSEEKEKQRLRKMNLFEL